MKVYSTELPKNKPSKWYIYPRYIVYIERISK